MYAVACVSAARSPSTAAMLRWTLLSLLLTGAWSQTCKKNQNVTDTDLHTQCLYCFYEYEANALPPKPQLLWAATGSALLRARLCGCWCRSKVHWYYRNITRDTSLNTGYQNKNVVGLQSCTAKQYCEISGSPGSAVKVHSSFFNYRVDKWYQSHETYVKFCPDEAPAPPEAVSCRVRGEQRQLRWLRRRDASQCSSHTQFMVRTEGVREWFWLGEESPPLLDSPEPFGGLVHLCLDDPSFLCANLSATLAPERVKLGVRRVDSERLNASVFVECTEYKEPSPPPRPETQPAVLGCPKPEPPPLPPVFLPSPTEHSSHAHPPGSSPRLPSGRHHPRACGQWNTMALVALAGLLLCLLLLPLAFFAGRRSRGKKQLGVSWQALRDDRSELRGGSVHDERPPLYNYDYANGLPPPRSPLPPLYEYNYDYANGLPPPRSPLPPPLPPPLPSAPPPLPPPRELPYAVVRNDIYVLADDLQAQDRGTPSPTPPFALTPCGPAEKAQNCQRIAF